MTEPSRAPQRFDLRARPPVRPLAAAAAAALAGAVTLVLGAVGKVPALMVAGTVVLAAGLALAGLGWLFWRRLQTTVLVDGAAIVVTRGRRTQPRRTQTMPWSDVDRVATDDIRLTLVSRVDARPDLVIVNPQAATQPVFAALLAAVQTRLDADRGYRPFD